MPSLINWNVVSSRLRRYLFNNRTESNWLCKEKSASMQASESRLILLSERYTALWEQAEAQCCAPQPHICPSANSKGTSTSTCGVSLTKGRAAEWLWLCPLCVAHGSCAVLLLQNASQCPHSVLQRSSATSYASQTLLGFSSSTEFKLSI